MCTTASPSEVVLMVVVLFAPLLLLPAGAAVTAWRTGSRRWALAAAGLALLPLVFVLRAGLPQDAPSLAFTALLALSVLAALTFAGVLVAAYAGPSTCERLMSAPTVTTPA